MVEENKLELTLSSNGTLPKRRVRQRRRYLLNTIPQTRLTGYKAAAFSLLRRCGRRRRKTDCGRQRSVFWRFFSSGGLIPPHFFRPPLLSRYILSVCGSHFSHYSFFHFFFLHRDQPSSGDDQ